MGEAKQQFLKAGHGVLNAELSQFFGKPCFKIGGKAFVAFFQDEMVFKLDQPTHGRALALSGAKLFDPSGKGRAMKEWVQVPYERYELWPSFAQQACLYTSSH